MNYVLPDFNPTTESPPLLVLKPRPVRVQRTRAKGSKLPPNTVCVTRPGPWGNPYPAAKYGLDLSLALFANTARGCWNPGVVAHLGDAEFREVYDLHAAWVRRIRDTFNAGPVDAARLMLRGMNLACWCPMSKRCHSEILLAVANDWEMP